MALFVWRSDEEMDSLKDVLWSQVHSVQPVFNGKALHHWVNAALADGNAVLYSATTSDSAPPKLHDDWTLVTQAENLECLVSTEQGLTDAGRRYALKKGWEATAADVVEKITQQLPQRNRVARPAMA